MSYAHESAGHKEQVLELCRFLRHAGTDIRVDAWDTDRRRDWFEWMTEQILRSDFIVVVASDTYRRAADTRPEPGFHRGVQTEAAQLRDLLHGNREMWLPKLLPVVLPGQHPGQIPLFLQPFCADFYCIEAIDAAGCEDLLRALTGRPSQIPPPLGPAFPPYTPTPHTATARLPAVPALPRDIRSFTGREFELNQLLKTAAQAAGAPSVTIQVVDGMPGAGKTAFAIHVAHRLVTEFPDGQIFLELHGHADGREPLTPDDALASLLLASGVAGDQIPTRLEDRVRLWNDRVEGKRLLLVLDNVVDHQQVEPLIPDAPGCLVLITSRRRLTILDAQSVSLGQLEPKQAEEMFVRLSRIDRPVDRRALSGLMRKCGHLPLAIAVLAGRLHSHPTWTLAYLEEKLCQARRRVAELATPNLAVAAAFSLSYRALPADQQRLFRRLGLHPGTDFDVEAAAALDGADVEATRGRLEALYLDSLIAEPAAGRYRLHDLTRDYTRALLDDDPADERDQAVDRLLEHYLRASIEAGEQIPGDATTPAKAVRTRRSTEQALQWLETERATLFACANLAQRSGRAEFVVEISAALHAYLRLSGRWDRARHLHRAALAAVPRRDRAARALAHKNLGVIEWLLDDYHSALANLDTARGFYRRFRSQRGHAATLIDLGAVHGVMDDHEQAVRYLIEAYMIYSRIGESLGQAIALSELGAALARNHDYQAAAASIDLAFARFLRLDDRRGQANVLNVRATIHHAFGQFAEAMHAATTAHAHYTDLGDLRGQAITVNILGDVCCSTGDYHRAIGHHRAAFELYSEIGSTLGQGFTLNNLGRALHGAAEYRIALDALSEAREIFNGLNKRTGEAETLNNLGELARSFPEAGRSLVHHREALALARETGGTLQEARALEGIGRAGQHNDTSAALTALRQAKELFHQLRAPQAIEVGKLIAAIEDTRKLAMNAAAPGRRRLLPAAPLRRGRHRGRRRHGRD